jgi:hypothetical protein
MRMAQQDKKDEAVQDSNLAFLDTFINWVKKKKLEMPATFFLEMNRPLMPLAHPLALLSGTFIAPFFGPDYYEKIEALKDSKFLDNILDKLAGNTNKEVVK